MNHTDSPISHAEMIAAVKRWIDRLDTWANLTDKLEETRAAHLAELEKMRAVLAHLERTPPGQGRIIEIAFDDYDAAERAFDRLEHMRWIMEEGGHLSMYGCSHPPRRRRDDNQTLPARCPKGASR